MTVKELKDKLSEFDENLLVALDWREEACTEAHVYEAELSTDEYGDLVRDETGIGKAKVLRISVSNNL